MRSLSSIRCFSLRGGALALAVLLVGVVGCPKQENFPAALDVVVPPTPDTFTIINPSGTAYEFDWAVSDPTNVDHYRLYLLGGIQGAELLVETTEVFYDVTFGFSVEGLQFAISAVTAEGVEGYRAEAIAP